VTTSRQSWAVVVPVKRLDVAKTRPDVGSATRIDLALAMATDTVRACLSATAVSVVVVVTDDERAAAAVRELGARVVADEPDAGLNPALAHGLSVARRARPDCGVALLSSDLPALGAADLAAALTQAAGHDVTVVADAAGTGTVLLTARPGVALAPAFGLQSLASHTAAGAVTLAAALPGLRRDVDTAEDLAAAQAMGVGPHTAALLGGR